MAASVAQKFLFFPNGSWCRAPAPARACPGAGTLKDSRTSYYSRRAADRMDDSDAGRSRWQQRYDQAAQSGRRRAGGGLHHAVRAGGGPGLRAAARRGGARTSSGSAGRGSSRSPAACTPPATGAGRGRSASSPGSATRGRPTSGTRCCCGRGRRAVGGLRHADADGPRLRRPALAGRGRALRGGHRLGGRHGRAVRGHPAGRRHHLDDDQRAGRPGLLHVPGRGRAPGRGPGRAGRHAADRHLQGVHRAEGVAVPAAAAPAADRRPDGVLRRGDPPATSRCRCPATTSGRRARRPRRSSRSPWPTGSATWNSACPAAWTSTSSRRACRSSSTRTSTSSRRSPSSAPPGGSGPGGCATSTAPRPSGPSGCASTPRRRACR